MDYHFEVLRSRNASNKVHFWWRIRSSNWKILSSSEMYTTKNNCLRVIKPMMKRIGKKFCDFNDLT